MLANPQLAIDHQYLMQLGLPFIRLAAAIYVLFVLDVGGDVMSLDLPFKKGAMQRARQFLVTECGMGREVLLNLQPHIVKTYAWMARNFAPADGNPSPVAVGAQPLRSTGVRLTPLEGLYRRKAYAIVRAAVVQLACVDNGFAATFDGYLAGAGHVVDRMYEVFDIAKGYAQQLPYYLNGVPHASLEPAYRFAVELTPEEEALVPSAE